MPEPITWSTWSQLEGAARSFGSLNARRLTRDGIVLAIDHRGLRHVLIGINDRDQGFNDSRSRGISVTTRHLQVEGEQEGLFLDVCCTDPAGLDAFNLLATEMAAQLANGSTGPHAVRETIARSRRFWGEQPPEGLRPEEVRGLFGELWFLLVWLFPDDVRQVVHWVGPMGAVDDFQWPGNSVEVKTTSSIRGHIHRISGLDQLEPPEGGELCLFSLRLRDEPASGNSLVSLVRSIKNVLREDPELLTFFEDRLSASGYSPAHDERYEEMRFRVISERLYRVAFEFPKLTPSSFADGIPRGVESVQYEINLDAISELLIAANPGDYLPPRS